MFLACKVGLSYTPLLTEITDRQLIQLTGAGIIPWSPLARGFLTRSLAEQLTTARSEKDPYLAFMTKDNQEACKGINTAVQKVAEARGYSMAQVSLVQELGAR